MRCIDEVVALKEMNKALEVKNATMVLETKLRKNEILDLKDYVMLRDDVISDLNAKQVLLNAKVARRDDTIDMLNAKCASQRDTILSQEEELEQCYHEREEGKEYKTDVDIQALQAECKKLDRRNLQQAQRLSEFQHSILEKNEKIASLERAIAKLENTIEILENTNSLRRKMITDIQKERNKAEATLNKIDNLSAEDWFGFKEFDAIANILREYEGVK